MDVHWCSTYSSKIKETLKLELIENFSLIIPEEYLNHFWLPDTWLTTSKGYAKGNQKSLRLMTIERLPDGICNVLYIERMASLIACQFDLKNYPFESQSCNVQLRSCEFYC